MEGRASMLAITIEVHRRRHYPKDRHPAKREDSAKIFRHIVRDATQLYTLNLHDSMDY